MIFRLDAQLSKHHPSRRRELSIRTFLYVEKLLTVRACIRPDILATRLNATQCSISYGISFQNIDMGRQLQLTGRCGFLSWRAHPYGKSRIQKSDVRTTVFMVRTWELHIHIHRPYSYSYSYSYSKIACIRFTVQTTDVMVRTCQALIWKLHAAKVRPFGRQGNTIRTQLNSRKNFYEILESPSHSCPLDALCLPSGWRLGISSWKLKLTSKINSKCVHKVST
jgi:hypothetical protein